MKCFSHESLEFSGRQVMDMTGLSSGVVYSALIVLEERGMLGGRFEPGPYPRRRLYHLRRDSEL
jgi:DNA-binding PadR family transcriptional regulator